MPSARRRRRHSSPEITASQEIVEAIGGMGVGDDEPTSPRPLTRSMTQCGLLLLWGWNYLSMGYVVIRPAL